jgi:hypothetical protein
MNRRDFSKLVVAATAALVAPAGASGSPDLNDYARIPEPFGVLPIRGRMEGSRFVREYEMVNEVFDGEVRMVPSYYRHEAAPLELHIYAPKEDVTIHEGPLSPVVEMTRTDRVIFVVVDRATGEILETHIRLNEHHHHH